MDIANGRDLTVVLAQVLEVVPERHPLIEDLRNIISFTTYSSPATLDNCWLMAKASILRHVATNNPNDNWGRVAIDIFANQTTEEW